jgi:hypothetical protein
LRRQRTRHRDGRRWRSGRGCALLRGADDLNDGAGALPQRSAKRKLYAPTLPLRRLWRTPTRLRATRSGLVAEVPLADRTWCGRRLCRGTYPPGEASMAETLGRGVTAAEWRALREQLLIADRVGGDPRAVLNEVMRDVRTRPRTPRPLSPATPHRGMVACSVATRPRLRRLDVDALGLRFRLQGAPWPERVNRATRSPAVEHVVRRCSVRRSPWVRRCCASL